MLVTALASLAACAGGLPPQARYAGTLAGCEAGMGGASPESATLTRRGPAVAFAPGDGVLVLRGSVAADGTFSASLNTQPPGKPPFLLQVSGTLTEAQAQLRYQTPRCTATGTLRRTRGEGLVPQIW